MDFKLHRPKGYTGEGDQYLLQLARDLKHLIIKTEGALAYKTLYLPNKTIEELANVLVEFAEDIHNSIGIWDSLERYNLEFFNTRLPFILKQGENTGQETITEQRLRHLLWILYSELNPQLVLSPAHKDLKLLAKIVSDFLTERFTTIPPDSGIKAFLSQPDKKGWAVKRKLVWLGTHSYLFRHSFRNYVEDHGQRPDIPTIDDFVCQHTTQWSGLGAIDILAAVLDISPEQHIVLRSWYERHMAYYRIMAIKGLKMEVLNGINDRPYVINMGEGTNPFEIGQVVIGSLVPWNKKWYWSGQQYNAGNLTGEELEAAKDAFMKKSSQIAYRYCDQLHEKAKETVKRHRQEFIDYHGNDMAFYPNGLSMTADLQKEKRLQWEAEPPELIAKVMEKHNLSRPCPSMTFPQDLINNSSGIAVYYNPDEGQEIMTGFNYVISGLKKTGRDMSNDEEDSLRGFIYSESVSHNFVKRVIQEYGDESIISAFLLQDCDESYRLDYLLRRYKGAYYRKRYPRISFV